MDRQQFIEHVEDNQRAVRRFLTALCCGDSALADDLAQDTFLKAYLSCDGFKDDSKFTTWIYRIAYNTFISNRRALRINEPITAADNICATDTAADKAYEYQPLYNALEQLSDTERSAVLLHYMQAYAIDEIAAITQSSAEAVRQRLSRARRHLKQLLNQ